MGRDMELIFIDNILKKIPPNLKPVDYLIKTLGLNREIVQRRLRGKTPFTFEEILILSKELNFSVDQVLLNKKAEYAVFKIQNDIEGDAEGAFIRMLRQHRSNMEVLQNSRNNQVIMSANHLLCTFVQDFETLFKFTYYKWMHQFGDLPLDFTFSDLNVSEEIKGLCKDIVEFSSKLNIVFIIDNHIILNTIREIKHYIESKMVNKKQTLVLKEELKDFIENTYTSSVLGISSSKNINREIYLSSVKIESNSSYMICDSMEFSYYWTFSDNFIYTSDSSICRLQKNWLDSLRKYSILISQSNQKMQAEFYNRILGQLTQLTNS